MPAPRHAAPRLMARCLAVLLALQTVCAAASAVYDDFTTYNSSVCKPVVTPR